MYVVRIERDEDSGYDYKAFTGRPDAERRFLSASVKVWDGEFRSAAWFDVELGDVRLAVEAVMSGDAKLVSLLGCEPNLNLDIDLSELGI